MIAGWDEVASVVLGAQPCVRLEDRPEQGDVPGRSPRSALHNNACTQHVREVRLGIWVGFVCVWRDSVHGTSAHLLFSLKGCFCVLLSLLKIDGGGGTLGGWRLSLRPGHDEPGEQPPFS